ncbi:MAG: hypothetical protein WAN51_02355 [Alphaproteobacteria bacterium]
MVESASVLRAILPKPLARNSAAGPANIAANSRKAGPAIGSGPNGAA